MSNQERLDRIYALQQEMAKLLDEIRASGEYPELTVRMDALDEAMGIPRS